MDPLSGSSSFTSTQSYANLNTIFNQTGITYKSNQTLHRLSQERQYPYLLLLHTAKLYHFNQFQVIFFSHSLYEYEPSYVQQPNIFEEQLKHQIINKAYDKIKEQKDSNYQNITPRDVRDMYTYLMVVGYSVKYYLNESVKCYQEQMKKIHPQFFTNIFNKWALKYGNKVLKTNPKKINNFYINIFQTQEAIDGGQVDCQYRNYNQIVQELIKATTQIQVPQKFQDIQNIQSG